MYLDLQDLANVATILLALLVAWIYLTYRRRLRQQRTALEEYLRKAKLTATGDDRGQRTLPHLVAQLGLPEADILQAAFDSKRIARQVATDKATGRTDTLFLVYDATATST